MERWNGKKGKNMKKQKMQKPNAPSVPSWSFNGWFGGKTHHFRKHPFDATPAENHDAWAVFLPKKIRKSHGTLDRLKKVVHISMNSLAVRMPSRGFLFDFFCKKTQCHNTFCREVSKMIISHRTKPVLVQFKGDIHRTLQTLEPFFPSLLPCRGIWGTLRCLNLGAT